MKKTVNNLISLLIIDEKGAIKGGFHSIKGGKSMLVLSDNGLSGSSCTNDGNCASTNWNSCTNTADCHSTTNSQTCNNQGTCFA